MRSWLLWLVVGAVLAGCAGPASASSATVTGPAAALIASDSGIDGVYALDGTVVYHRAATDDSTTPDTARPWMRVLNGRRLAVHGIPGDARAASMGRDANGRVVLTVRTLRRHDPWWLYDVRADVARPLRGLRSCNPGAVAVWRRRVAYFDDCGGSHEVVLQGPAGIRRFRAYSGSFEQVALRGSSLAAMGENSEDIKIYRLLDRGRRCDTEIEGGEADGPFWAQHVSIGDRRLAWVMGAGDIFDSPLRYTHLTVMAVALNGRCTDPPTQRYLGTRAPDTPVRAVVIDGRRLYYATDLGLYLDRLPARGSTAAPANDNFEQATVLRGPLPIQIDGTVGHATRQPGEPEITWGTGTVWHRFQPLVDQRVNVDISPALSLGHRILVGDRLDALTAFSLTDGRYTFDAIAGQSYWIVVSAFSPDYAPFRIVISSALP
jgi:hypothetical protein